MSISRRGGGIGRRAGLKIRFRKEWGFDSPPRHHRLKTPDIHLGFFCFNLFQEMPLQRKIICILFCILISN